MDADKYLLFTMLLNNAIRAITAEVKNMSDEEVAEKLAAEKERNAGLMAELESH